MNQAMPARLPDPLGVMAVSSDPHSLPLANVTCCMRVSFESGLAMTSGLVALWTAVLTNRR